METVELCRDKCLEVEDCNMFTHFGASSHPFVSTCILLKSCASLSPCDDCTSGAVTECTCGIGYECIIDGDNLEMVVEDVPSEGDCAKQCQDNDQCSVYTYYSSTHPADPNLCILLSKCGRVWPELCQDCSSGPQACYQSDSCGFAVWQGMDDMMVIKENTTLHLLSGERGCSVEVMALAIGGGGKSGVYGGAGGSGFPKKGTIKLISNTDIQVTVGAEIASTINIEGTQEVLLSAAPGQDGYMYDGGDGYSGGGAYGAAGGSDGGDGEMSSYGEGGIGSGIDVKIYEMKNVVLRAGNGGGSYGGGAGGIVVNGESPDFNENHQGEGFGGGGGALPPIQGCVVLELFDSSNMTLFFGVQ